MLPRLRLTWEKRIKRRFYRLAAFAILAVAALPAAAQPLGARVHAVLAERGLGDDALRIIGNVLEHEGARVCREARGSARTFQCAYHGWTYFNTGKLRGVPWPERKW